MSYQVVLTSEAIEDLRSLDRAIAQRVLRRLKWLSQNLDNLKPEALSGEWKGLLKLRVGSYRVLYTVIQGERVILVHLIGHRKDIYKKK